MRVRMLRQVRQYKAGAKVELPDQLGELWIGKGLARPIVEAKALDAPPRDKTVKRTAVSRKAK